MPRKSKEKTNNLDDISAKTKKATTSKNKQLNKTNTNKKKQSLDSKTTKKTTVVKTSKTKTTTRSTAKESKTSTTKKTRTTKVPKKISVITETEYYDLPFRYNQTVVKILAQTPNTLFIYWDISDKDKDSFIKKYGEDFFYNTKPYLVINNETMNYSFDVEINDFANSWYLHVNDENCKYKVELGRKFITNSNSPNFTSYNSNDYLYITSSNEMQVPNNHILFDELGNSVFFRNVKTNIIQEKNISSISFLRNIGKVYNIYDLYKEIYGNDLISTELNIPSSHSSYTSK